MDPDVRELALLIAVSLGPGILWVWFFYSKDRAEPEPKWLVVRAFVLGGTSVFPAALVESPFRGIAGPGAGGLVHLLLVSVVVVGLVEEAAKLGAVRLAAYRSPQFNEVMDGIVYAVAAGLGFAAIENLLYATTFGVAVGVLRAFVTDLAHASFSGIVGYYLGRAKSDPGRARALVGKGLTIAVILHGVYDALIIGRIASPALAVAIILLAYAFLSVKIAKARRMSPFRPQG